MRALALAALVLCACAEPDSDAVAEEGTARSLFAAAPDRAWRLPDALREISGLAVTIDGRLFAHDDERAILYELDVEAGGVVKSFAVGEPVARGDFEGLAITPDGDFYLTTSAGRLLRFREGADGARAPFESFDSGLGRVCEIEGLAFLPADASLILACKINHARNQRGVVALFAWTTEDHVLRPWLSLPQRELAAAAGVGAFNASGVDVDARTGRLVLIAARGRALAELGEDGELLSMRRLGPAHVQAEGVAVLPDGALVIADEGRGGRALLARYPSAHD